MINITIRLFKKAVMLSTRSKKRFIAFLSMYTFLIIWMSFSLQTAINTFFLGNEWISSFAIAVIASIFSSIIYAWLLIRFRRLEIATLKCIGYTNNNIRSIIMGEIIWVTLCSSFVVFEFLIHWTAIDVIGRSIMLNDLSGYALFLHPFCLLTTIGIFLIAQLGGISVAYRKILKLRPIIALRVMK